MPVNNVTREYPPTLLIHGTEDTDVPCEQSVMMADEFKKYGIDHELIMIAGETREWETVEYVRDPKDMGRSKALILLGHCISEEAGMKYCSKWLKTFVKGVPIKFIPTDDPF
jgi:hypothetical protein